MSHSKEDVSAQAASTSPGKVERGSKQNTPEVRRAGMSKGSFTLRKAMSQNVTNGIIHIKQCQTSKKNNVAFAVVLAFVEGPFTIQCKHCC